jgi:hypothetical protein
MSGPFPHPRAALRAVRALRALLLALALPAGASGCVERLLQIRSDPPGAAVYLNGELLGKTPLDHRFDYYGSFDVTLRSERSLSLHKVETVHAPWYQWFPIDFFAENVVPWRVRDQRKLRYTLEPAPPLSGEAAGRALLETRGRLEALEGRLSPPAAASP